LPGTLSIPNGGGRYAAVVLVHGSGPQDADETIGPNKPFKDLAWGLASRKIAVLRYNKRTLEHAASFKDAMSGLTVKEETIDDARAAVALLAQQPEIDPKRIFVIGHSLGGMLAPRIAQGDPQVAGIILMAGTLNRSLGQVIVEQLKYLASLEGANPAEAQAQISAAEKAAKEIDSPELKPDATVNVLGSAIPGSYWLDLRGYDSVRLAAQLKIPILVLQGDRDFQVTVPDYEAWKKPFAGDPRVTFKLYPGLHHLFMPSEAKGSALATPADYEKPGHVVEAVVSDIASWVSSQVPM
jgi:dienelactone hydrolase